MLSRVFLFLVLVSSAVAFKTPTFKYGCNETQCVYTFVMPEEVANYVDEGMLKIEVSTLTNLTNILSASAASLNESPEALTNFTDTFNEAYNNATEPVTEAQQNTTAVAPAFETAATGSSALYSVSELVNNLTSCLFDAGSSTDNQKTCFGDNPVPGPVSSLMELSDFLDE